MIYRSVPNTHDERFVADEAASYLPDFSINISLPHLLFSWFTPLVVKCGGSNHISKNDLFMLPNSMKSETTYNNLILCWTFEDIRSRIYSGPDRQKLWKVLHSLIFVEFWYCGFCRLISDIAVLVGAILIKNIISAAENNEVDAITFYAFAILFNSIVQAIMLQQFIAGSFNCGSQVVSATTSAVYHAALSLKLQKMDSPRTLGEINNIQSKDAASLRDFVVFFHNLWSCPLTIIVCVALLIYLLGWAGIVCFLVTCCLLPIESYIAKKAKAYRKVVLKNSDKRMMLVNEIIDGIWTVKLTGISSFIFDRVCRLREEELDVAWKCMLIELVNVVLTKSGTIIITLTTFAVYIALAGSTGQHLTADKAFSALALISIIGRPIQVIPKCISLWSDAMVSFDRIESLLDQARLYNTSLLNYSSLRKNGDGGGCDEFSSYQDDKGSQIMPAIVVEHSDSSLDVITVVLSHVTVTRCTPANSNHSKKSHTSVGILHDVSLRFQCPGLVIVIGGNASGKSSLLATIMNELVVSAGSVSIAPLGCRVAYCGHDSWIMNKSIKENILLGRGQSSCDEYSKRNGASQLTDISDTSAHPLMGGAVSADVENSIAVDLYDEVLLQEVLTMCALDKDIANWPKGVDTIVGEKGISISGGQKQRICLARALYSQARILLFDSILSGVDAIVTQDIFKGCIMRAAQDHLIVLCTHQLEFLPFAKQIVVMNAGCVVFDGSYENYIQQNIDVSQLSSEANSIKAGNESPSVSQPASKFNSSNSGTSALSSKTSPPSSLKTPSLKHNVPNGDELLANQGMKVYKRYAVAGGALLGIVSLVVTLICFASGAFSDYQLARYTDGDYTALYYLLIYTTLSVCTIGLNFCRYYWQYYFGITASLSLHQQLLRSIMGATFDFFHSVPSGRITSRFSIDFDTIDFSIPQNMSSFLDAALGIVTGIGVVVFASPYYIIAALPLTILYFRIQSQYRPLSKQLKTLDSATKSPLFSLFRETLAGSDVIRGYRIEHELLRQYHELLDDSIKVRLNWDAANRWLGIRLDLIGSFIVSSAAFSLLWSVSLGSRSASGGTAGLMLSYALKATQSLSFAVRSSTALENMMTSVERVVDYIDVPQEADLAASAAAVNRIPVPAQEAGNLVVELNEDNFSNEIGNVFEIALNPLRQSPYAKTVAFVEGENVALRGENVTVRYASHLPAAIRNQSFTLHRGRVVGVCGRSGSGKSTLAMVLARAFPDLEGGRLLMDGDVDVSSLPLMDYRKQVAVFPQDSYIFSGSLREYLDPTSMLTKMNRDAYMIEILNELTSAVTAELSEDCKKNDALNIQATDNRTIAAAASSELRHKQLQSQSISLSLDKVIASGGSNLSAGEKQVAVLARAVLCSATHAVVLDEITSNMDRGAAIQALRVLKKYLTRRVGVGSSSDDEETLPVRTRSAMMQNLSVVLIAHNLDDLVVCDEIWVMKDGEVVESGTPAELMISAGNKSQPTLFQEMWNARV